MKTLILLLIPFIVFASGETMNTSDYLYLKNLDRQPFKKVYKQSRINEIDKISKEKVKEIVKKITQEDVTSIKLTHSSRYLIYKISTQNYKLIINALDATLIKKEVL